MTKYGGKAIASGGYGCVFYPALKCKNEKERYDGVSKLLKRKDAHEEYEEKERIMPSLSSIPNYKDYILLPEQICEIKRLTKEDKKCVVEKCRKFKISEAMLMDYRILNMPFGGPDLQKFLLGQPLTSDIFVPINNSMLDMLENAIARFNASGLVHADLKAQNVLVTPENFKCKIIDWGLASVVNYTDKKDTLLSLEEDFQWKPLQFNIPVSNILFSNFFHRKTEWMYDYILKQNGTQDISDEELLKFSKKMYIEFSKSGNGNGHYDYIKRIVGRLKWTLGLKEKESHIIFKYIAQVIKDFPEMSNGKIVAFDYYRYYNEVFRHNCCLLYTSDAADE